MPYFLLAAGIFLLLYGGYLLKKENNVTNAGFRQILSRQSTEREEYISLLALSQEIKSKLDYTDNKLDHILQKLEAANKSQAADPEEYASNADYTDDGLLDREGTRGSDEAPPEDTGADPDDAGARPNMEKGELKYIRKLLKE